jgi:catechol 2,3-dioxygenase-like lactoylglutathione lyase family enzyme
VLGEGRVATRIPVQDLQRARRFYADKLGLEPSEERPGGLLYRCASGEFALFESAGGSSGSHTQMGWDVDDIEAEVAELKRRGVVFEEVDLPGLKTVDGIAEVSGNYPSKGGRGERAAWFRDSEGNMLGLGEPIRSATTRQEEMDAIARAIIDENSYMTLGTADADGHPWVSPVWYAPERYGSFYWVSDPEAKHSRNLATRPQVSIVIFDSRAPVGSGQGVYVTGVGEQITGADLDHGMSVFSRRSQEQGAAAWTAADVQPPSRLRLYRATAHEHYVGDRNDRRVAVNVAG